MLEFVDAENETVCVWRYQMNKSEVGRERLTSSHTYAPLHFFGDREVFGMASEDGIQLWFFNPNFIPDIPDLELYLPMEESWRAIE